MKEGKEREGMSDTGASFIPLPVLMASSFSVIGSAKLAETDNKLSSFSALTLLPSAKSAEKVSTEF